MLREFVLQKELKMCFNVEDGIVAKSCWYRLMPQLAISRAVPTF